MFFITTLLPIIVPSPTRIFPSSTDPAPTETPSITPLLEPDTPLPPSAYDSTPDAAEMDLENLGPPIPEDGIPEGWTMEQWQFYGQEWLDSQED